MVDSRKVLKGLKCCASSACLSCPYDYRDLHCMVKMAIDACILLEEQPEEIVRCKDCNKRGQSVYRADGAEYIVCWNQGLGILHPIDWFCADGEKGGEIK